MPMTREPCAHISHLDETPREPCTSCMSFYVGLVNALILSSVAWGILFLVIHYIVNGGH
jgi:hypothetical protein